MQTLFVCQYVKKQRGTEWTERSTGLALLPAFSTSSAHGHSDTSSSSLPSLLLWWGLQPESQQQQWSRRDNSDRRGPQTPLPTATTSTT